MLRWVLRRRDPVFVSSPSPGIRKPGLWLPRSTWEPPSIHHGGTSLANRKCYYGDGHTDQEMGRCGRQDFPSPSHRIHHEASAVVSLSVDIKSSFQDWERAGGAGEG